MITATGAPRQAVSGLRDMAAGGSQQRDAVWSMTSELRELMECDPGIISDLLSLFLEDSAARLQVLSCACDAGDFRIVRAQAHSLKGSSLQVGAAWLGALCAALELSNETEPEICGFTMREMISAVEEEFILVRRAIEGYLDAHTGLK